MNHGESAPFYNRKAHLLIRLDEVNSAFVFTYKGANLINAERNCQKKKDK